MYVNTFTFLFLCSTVNQSTKLVLDQVPFLQKQILRYTAQTTHPKLQMAVLCKFLSCRLILQGLLEYTCFSAFYREQCSAAWVMSIEIAT